MRNNVFKYVWVAFCIISGFSYAQPTNDNCLFAQVIVIPEDGDTCLNGTNFNATADGISNPCDAATLGGQPAGGNEVWYTYIATGTQNTITVNPQGGGAQFVSVTIPTGNCTNSGYNICNTAASPNGQATVLWNFVAGTQVWFSVTSLLADGAFEVCVSSITPPADPLTGAGDNCSDAILICDKHSFTSNGPIPGNSQDTIVCYPFGPQNVVWYKFTVGVTGTLEWIADPLPGYELDWALYDITSGCPGTNICCNWSFTAGGGAPTGMSLSSVSPCNNSNQICQPMIVNAGNTYAIQLNCADFINAGIDTARFDMTWGGTFKMTPHADFSINTSGSCDSVHVTFVNSSSGGNSYAWDFGNGNTSIQQNPPPQDYTTQGTYVITLTVNSTAGCSNIYTQPVKVSGGPSSAFDSATDSVCAFSEDSIFYTGSTNSNYSYSWNFAGGTILSGTTGTAGPFKVSWNNGGVKVIALTVTDTSSGCISQIATDTLYVRDLPDSSISAPAGGCDGVNFNVSYGGVSLPGAVYNWNFGLANVISGSQAGPYSINYTGSGVYSIYLQVNDNGCISDDSTQIFISVAPIADAGIDVTLCSGDSLTIGSAPVIGTLYQWFPVVGLNSSTVADPKISLLNISLIADTNQYIVTASIGGCSRTDTVLVIIRKKPTSSFVVSNDSLCGNEVITISYSGSGVASAIYQWDFSGGNAVNTLGQNYNVNWIAAGNDTISLFVTEGGCSSDTTYVPIVIQNVPASNAGSDVTICSGDSVSIGTPALPGYNYVWSPTAGLNSSTFADPTVFLTNTTPFIDTVQFVVETQNGFCQSSDTINVAVKPIQLASISGPTDGCISGNSLVFSNSAPGVSGAGFSWLFGNNANPSSSNLSNPVPVTYSDTGVYQVLLITSTPGCKNDTDIVSVTIHSMPAVGFTQDVISGCPPLSVQFTDTSTTALGSYYLWGFGNGDISTSQNPSYVYNYGGNYAVTLIITSPDSCSSSFTSPSSINIFNAPLPQFKAEPQNTTIVNPVISFFNLSQNTDSCLYLFGDGTSSMGCNPVHIYKDTGTYTVTLITKNTSGCVDTATTIVKVDAYFSFFIPNAFTPNDDKRNDVLVWKGEGMVSFEIEIFNRWGQVVFVTDNQNDFWDGTYGGSTQLVPDGIYAYFVRIKDTLGKWHNMSGTVSAIK